MCSTSSKQALSVSLVSLGCPKNLVDSESMLARLAEAGLVVGAPMDDADVIVVNTCGFLSAARDESLEVIREALEQKRRGRTRRVVVAGCLVNRDAKDLCDSNDGIDALVGVNNRDDIIPAVTGRKRLTRLDAYNGEPAGSDAGRFRLTPRHTAYLRICEGCSRRCTFCTIPAIRGPLRSKTPEAVLAEARELADDGAVEINVIGQDTTAYGMDLNDDPAPSLCDILRRLDRLDGLRWIRLLYAYPSRFSDELIDVIAGAERIVPYVDMPLQHISTGVLRRMGRGVTRSGVEGLLGRLRRKVPPLVLRTTLIAGFPGESDGEFQELLEFVKDFRFEALGVFAFSPERGTPAASMPGQLPDEVKAQRVDALMLAQQEIAFEQGSARVGSPVEILVDGTDSRGYCIGRHYGQAPDIDGRCVLSEPRAAGSFVRAEVVDSDAYDLVVEPS